MESAASVAASGAASAAASAVQRASRRLRGGGRASSTSSGSSAGGADCSVQNTMLDAVLPPWVEEEGITDKERTARESTATEIRRAHLHQLRFGTEAEEMAWLEDELSAFKRPSHGFWMPQTLAQKGLDTPSKVWEAVSGRASGTSRFGRHNNFLSHFYKLGPHVVIDAPISRLPVGWSAPDSLVITSSSGRLQALPDGLRVAGSLVLSDSHIVALPPRLEVKGDLVLKGATCLAALPSDMRVGGSLVAVHCSALVEMPVNLGETVRGAIEFRECGRLAAVPPLHVHGDFSLTGCGGVTALPEALRVDGGLKLVSTSLASLPWDNLHVCGDLKLIYCRALTSLPAELRVDGKLDVTHCSGISALPGGLRVDGDVNLCGLAHLVALPVGFAPSKVLSIQGCDALVALPAGLRLAGLDARRCDALAELPGDIVVDGPAVLGKGLTALPASGRLLGDIVLDATTVPLPDDLHVKGGLELRNCAYKAIPAGLVVEGDLSVTGCRELTALPSDARVLGALTIEGCQRLAGLPATVHGPVSLTDTAVQTLPDTWGAVPGDLVISGCWQLSELPTALRVVEGGLTLRNCPRLTKLRATLRVEGSLHVANTGVTELPWGNSLHVRGDLALNDKLTRLPRDELRVDGKCVLSGCAQLTSLPLVLDVGGALTVSHCAIDALPMGMKVGGDVVLARLPMLAALPEDLADCANKGLSLRECPLVSALPPGLHLEVLDVDRCPLLAALPEDLVVGGDLSLRMLPVASLPATARFLGSITLHGCDLLEALPSGLHVQGDFIVRQCNSLTDLPEGLRVEMDMHLQSLTSLEELPGGLVVEGGFSATQCPLLREVPADARFGGNVDVASCVALKLLPDDMHIRGNLDVSACGSLGELPAGLTVDGDLRMKYCGGITALPARLEVRGDLIATRSGLTQLVDGWHARGSLHLDDCADLVALPVGLTVDGQLNIRQCVSLDELPVDMHIRGNFEMSSCGSLGELPAGLTVDGDLRMKYCGGITALPARLEVHGDLIATRSGLTQLVDGWHARGSLHLDDCVGLVELPEGLTVGGNLLLNFCVSLTELPDDDGFQVDGDLGIEGCTGITALPDCVLAWGMCSNGQPHNIILQGTRLPPEELARLQALDNPALSFLVGYNETFGGSGLGADNFPALDDAARFWAKEAGVPGEGLAIEPFVEAAYVRGALGFLSKLRRAKEFNNSRTKRGLASRVVQVLRLVAGEDNDLREELLVRMADAVDTCSDKPMWALNQMQVLVHISEARGDREALRALGMGVMRLEVVHQHVRKAMDAMTFIDDVCVYLRFEIALRESLQLPVSALAMLYPSYITVTQESIDAAEAEALGVTEADLAAWLPDWGEWQRQDRVEFAEELDFAALKRNSTKRLSLSLRSLLGNKVADPVRVRPAKAVWSLAVLMKHWINTGMDLNNTPRDVDYMRLNLTKCI